MTMLRKAKRKPWLHWNIRRLVRTRWRIWSITRAKHKTCKEYLQTRSFGKNRDTPKNPSFLSGGLTGNIYVSLTTGNMYVSLYVSLTTGNMYVSLITGNIYVSLTTGNMYVSLIVSLTAGNMYVSLTTLPTKNFDFPFCGIWRGPAKFEKGSRADTVHQNQFARGGRRCNR